MHKYKGKEGAREWTQYNVSRIRAIIVQRAKRGYPWYIFDSKRGAKGAVKTVGYDMSRKRAEEKALLYIKGLES